MNYDVSHHFATNQNYMKLLIFRFMFAADMIANNQSKTEEKKLECPIPHGQRKPLWAFIKKMGVAGFLFFLIKGLLWLIIPYLIAKGIF